MEHKIDAPSQDYKVPPGLEKIVEEDWKRGLHRVVGKDGVLMISLPDDTDRAENSRAKLAEIGIHPKLFWGTDGRNRKTSQAAMDRGIDWAHATSDVIEHYKPGSVHARSVAGLADSHRGAIVEASQRNETWTAIMEDDAVPADERMDRPKFFEAFESAWAKIPSHARLVRLGYCQLRYWNDPEQAPSLAGLELDTYADGGKFRFTRWMGLSGHYQAGGCTTAYMVHRDMIPELLSLFPCPCTLDCCFNNLFNKNTDGEGSHGKSTKGLGFLVNLEPHISVDMAFENAKLTKGYEFVAQFGILKQDWDTYPDGTTKKSFTEPAFLDTLGH